MWIESTEPLGCAVKRNLLQRGRIFTAEDAEAAFSEEDIHRRGRRGRGGRRGWDERRLLGCVFACL